MISAETLAQLKTEAIATRLRAYAPYSRYQVGAALQCKSGAIYTGCNVENASYGLTICAERSAIFQMVSNGEQEITAVVVCTENGGAPCGACRQVLAEFATDCLIYLIDPKGQELGVYSLGELLPHSFGRIDLV